MPNKRNPVKDAERSRARQERKRNGTPHSQANSQPQMPLPPGLPQRPSWIPLPGATIAQPQMPQNDGTQVSPSPAPIDDSVPWDVDFDLGDLAGQQQQQFVFEQDDVEPAHALEPGYDYQASDANVLGDPARLFAFNAKQPSQRSASSSGGLADQRVRSADGNSLASNNPMAVTYPALGQGLSSTTGPATTPSMLSGGSGPAAITAGYDFDKEVDQVLIEEGWKPAAEMDNDVAIKRYGQCSIEHHLMLLLMDPEARLDIAAFVAQGQAQVPRGEYDCRPSHLSYKRITTRARCPHCQKTIPAERFTPNRLLAVWKLPFSELWKAVIRCRNGKTFVFVGSAMCCVFQGQEHCITFDHVQLETYRHNFVRRTHNEGRAGCWCPVPCLGDSVKHRTLTSYETQHGQAKGKVPI